MCYVSYVTDTQSGKLEGKDYTIKAVKYVEIAAIKACMLHCQLSYGKDCSDCYSTLRPHQVCRERLTQEQAPVTAIAHSAGQALRPGQVGATAGRLCTTHGLTVWLRL